MAAPQSTSLRTELDVVLSNPGDFYNIIMERSGMPADLAMHINNC
jgi:hypothetical protein